MAKLRTIFMDAGQGDATLMILPDGEAILVDCGCIKNGKIVVDQIFEVLKREVSGTKLKALVLTHADSDHCNLVKPLIIDKKIPIDILYYSGDVSDYAADVSTWIKNNAAKKDTQIGTVVCLSKPTFSALPVKELSYIDKTNPVDVRIISACATNDLTERNESSIVLMVSYKGINMFLMGDGTVETEAFIMEQDKKAGGPIAKLIGAGKTALKLGHHGSASSSSADWLNYIKPQVVFVSSDTRAFSGVSLPRSGVIKKLMDLGTLYDFSPKGVHHYVQYRDSSGMLSDSGDVHEMVQTTKAIYSTLHYLRFTSTTEFTAYGTSWYYDIADNGGVDIFPAIGWERVDNP